MKKIILFIWETLKPRVVIGSVRVKEVLGECIDMLRSS